MSGTAIANVHAWEALDSRGRPTVGCTVTLRNGSRGRAIVPSGASKGGHEAVELRDGGTRYAGYGVTRAVNTVNGQLAELVRGNDALDRPAIDTLMESADTDPALANIGANAVLSVSLAVTIAAANGTAQELWESVSNTATPLLPLPMVNIISGGAHAAGAIDIQDVLVVPIGARTFHEAIEWADRVRRATATLVQDLGANAALLADEGGLAAPFRTNEDALRIVTDGIHHAGLEPGTEVCLALDIAANQLLDGDHYRLRDSGAPLTAAELIDTVATWCGRYPVISIEDILAEDSWQHWQSATRALGRSHQLLGDDLFATSDARLTAGIESQVANAILIKPNQAGSVTRAETVVQHAHQAHYATVLSARSGDTEDTWLADLAVGWRTGQIKVGSTQRSERTAKWNRLLEIESRSKGMAEYAGAETLPAAFMARR